jgi:hypothetical protein
LFTEALLIALVVLLPFGVIGLAVVVAEVLIPRLFGGALEADDVAAEFPTLPHAA